MLFLLSVALAAPPPRVSGLAGERCARVVAPLDWNGTDGSVLGRATVDEDALVDCAGYAEFGDRAGNRVKVLLDPEEDGRNGHDRLSGPVASQALYVGRYQLLSVGPRGSPDPEFAETPVPVRAMFDEPQGADRHRLDLARRYYVVIDLYVEADPTTHAVRPLGCRHRPCQVGSYVEAWAWDERPDNPVRQAARDGTRLAGGQLIGVVPLDFADDIAPTSFGLAFIDEAVTGDGTARGQRGDLYLRLSIPGLPYTAEVLLTEESAAIDQPNVTYLAVVFRGADRTALAAGGGSMGSATLVSWP
jgi:hypothetical protein